MKDIYSIVLAILWGGLSYAQSPTDTLLHRDLQEVFVTQVIPLNQDQVAGMFQASRFSSIDDINARLPGVSLIRRGAYAMEPQLNGFSSGQINVTIDGMHLFGACTDKMDPVTSYIETGNLSSLSVNSGTGGAKMGSTVGGTLDMQLVEMVPQAASKDNFEAGYGYETVSDGHNANASWGIARKKFGLFGNVSFRKHNTYADGDGNNVSFSQFQKVNLFLSGIYQLSEHQQLKADAIYDEATDVGYPALPMDVATARGQIYGLEYQNYHLGNLSDIRAKLYYNNIYHLMDDSKRDSLFFINEGVDSVYMRMDMPGWSYTFGSFIEGNMTFTSGKKLFLKAEHYYNRASAEMTMFMTNKANPNEPPMFTETWPTTGRHVIGIFAEYPLWVSSNSLLSYSLRLDYGITKMDSENGKQQFTVFGNHIKSSYNNLISTSNLTFKQRLSNSWKSSLAIGYGERLPTITEQFGFFLYNAKDGYDYIGNPDINNEIAYQGSLDLSFSKQLFKCNFRSQISHITDYIYGVTNSVVPKMNLYAKGTKSYSNMAYATISSSSLEVIYDLSSHILLMSVSEFTIAEDNHGDPLPMIPPLNSNNLIQYKKGNFKCIGEFVIAAKQTRINSDYNEVKTPGYGLLNTRFQYNFERNNHEFKLFMGVNNVLDKTYKDHLDWGSFNRSGRNVFVQLYVTI